MFLLRMRVGGRNQRRLLIHLEFTDRLSAREDALTVRHNGRIDSS